MRSGTSITRCGARLSRSRIRRAFRGGAYGRRARSGYAEHKLGASPSGWPRSATPRAIRSHDVGGRPPAQGNAFACWTPSAGASQGAPPRRVRQSSVCPDRSIGSVPTMCRLPLAGTVARRTSPARPGARFAESGSRGALCRAALSPPAPGLSPSPRACLCRLSL